MVLIVFKDVGLLRIPGLTVLGPLGGIASLIQGWIRETDSVGEICIGVEFGHSKMHTGLCAAFRVCVFCVRT